MPQVLRPEFIGSITKLSATQISIAASNVIIGRQQYSTSAITVSTNGAGLNGLDTGTITANQFYYIFLVKSGLNVGGVISLSAAPAGFSSYKLIGQCTTQSASTDLEAANNTAVDTAPIGQIMSAMLTESQFRAIHGPGWILADGRSAGVAASKYGQLTAATTVPDLRGMVLRGKNNSRADGNQDPDGERSLGNPQSDSMQGHYHSKSETAHGHGITDSGHAHGITDPGHTHTVAVSGSTNAASSNARTEVGSGLRTTSNSTTGIGISSNTTGISIQGTTSNVSITNPSTDGTNGAPRTSNETRMRNVAVNHFIKIN